MTMHVYGFAPMNSGGCHWYRIRQPLAALQSRGHVCDWGAEFNEDVVTSHDVIVTHMLHEPAGVAAWGYLHDEGQHTLIYDIDDNVWGWPDGTEHAKYWTHERLANLETIMRMSSLITTPSMALALVITDRLGTQCPPVKILPNYVPDWIMRLDTPREHDGLVIGYQGAPQSVHQSDLDLVQVALFRILDKYPHTRLAFFGQPKPLEGAGRFTDRVDWIPWEPSIPEYYRSLQRRVDIGIGPLRDTPFTRCKSAIRMIEYAALGIPAVFSRVGPYKQWATANALMSPWCLFADTHQSWTHQLETLVNNPRRRDHLRSAGLAAASSWTSEQHASAWEAAYQSSRPARKVRLMPTGQTPIGPDGNTTRIEHEENSV